MRTQQSYQFRQQIFTCTPLSRIVSSICERFSRDMRMQGKHVPKKNRLFNLI